MKHMKLIIAGGRDFTNYKLADKEFFTLTEDYCNDQITVISGAARGADQIGAQLAKFYNTGLIYCPAQWDLYGKSAGYKRNALMASKANALLAFWDGKSKGTKHMIDLATKAGLAITVIPYN